MRFYYLIVGVLVCFACLAHAEQPSPVSLVLVSEQVTVDEESTVSEPTPDAMTAPESITDTVATAEPVAAVSMNDSTQIGEGDELNDMDDIEVRPQSSIQEWMNNRYVNDTLFISCSKDALPFKLVVHTLEGDVVYRLEPQYILNDTSSLLLHHPADSIYQYMWTNMKINPYGSMFDSLKDDVHIPMDGFTLPAKGHITSKYGWRRYRMHRGTDIKVQTGDSIFSAWPGQVRIVGWDPRGYGYYVLVRHDNGLETLYGHLSRPLVDEYDKIFPGDVIGLGGNTGRSTGSHLHLEIRYLGHALNPEKIIDFTNGCLVNDKEYVIGIRAIREQRAAEAAMRWHKVRSGDTLSAIARKYGTTVKRLCQLNKIKETKILQIGQKLRVR